MDHIRRSWSRVISYHVVYREEPVRFDSFRFRTLPKIIGSVRFGNVIFPVRRGSACVFRTRGGSIRFGSIRFRPVPAGSRIKRFDSVRPVRFGFLLLPDMISYHVI